MLRFDKVSFRYPEDAQEMFSELSFRVEDGEFAAIIGASGCGKSTIFRLINGLEKPDNGSVLVDDIPIAQMKNYSAFMPQKDLLFPWRSVEKNICLPMELAGIAQREQQQRAAEVLQQVGLTAYAKKYPKDLSGGMKQRAAFARTLLSGAAMLLLDEPFSALDFLTRVEMQGWLLRQWQHYHKTILFITHDVEEALFLAKTIYIIQAEHPVTEMERIVVPLDYPRNREDLKKPEIVELKESLIGKLRKGVSL